MLDNLGEGVVILYDQPWRAYPSPKLAAKVGARVQDRLPGEDPFVQPWMVGRAADHYGLGTSRAQAMVGWRPPRCLRETLPAMAAALRDDPARWYDVSGFGEPSHRAQRSVGQGRAR